MRKQRRIRAVLTAGALAGAAAVSVTTAAPAHAVVVAFAGYTNGWDIYADNELAGWVTLNQVSPTQKRLVLCDVLDDAVTIGARIDPGDGRVLEYRGDGDYTCKDYYFGYPVRKWRAMYGNIGSLTWKPGP